MILELQEAHISAAINKYRSLYRLEVSYNKAIKRGHKIAGLCSRVASFSQLFCAVYGGVNVRFRVIVQ